MISSLTRSGPDGPPSGETDSSLMARVCGVLAACGALFVLGSLGLPHPDADSGPLYGIAALAGIGGLALFTRGVHLRPWMVEAVLAAASVLVCLTIYFSGVASGVYSTMLVWVVVAAACFSSVRTLAIQTVWLLAAYGVTLALLADDSTGFSPVALWALTGFGLAVTAVGTSWLVTRRRITEEAFLQEIETRESLQRELEHLAHHDPLTGVANRRRLELYLADQLDVARKQGTPICLVALDLNGFKRYNDVQGHAAGDRLLKAAASAWTAVLRSGDLITRMGGDEFLAVLPDCPPNESERIAARLRAAVPLGETCSTGIACWDGKETAESLLARADEAMYGAKNRRPMSVYSP